MHRRVSGRFWICLRLRTDPDARGRRAESPDSISAAPWIVKKRLLGPSGARDTFRSKQDVDAVRHFLGTAWGWGGLPDEEVQYLNVEPSLPVGAYQITVMDVDVDVPVGAFWSISVYNRDGYFDVNEYDAYSVNNISGTPNPDGSFTIHFGGDPSRSAGPADGLHSLIARLIYCENGTKPLWMNKENRQPPLLLADHWRIFAALGGVAIGSFEETIHLEALRSLASPGTDCGFHCHCRGG